MQLQPLSDTYASTFSLIADVGALVVSTLMEFGPAELTSSSGRRPSARPPPSRCGTRSAAGGAAVPACHLSDQQKHVALG